MTTDEAQIGTVFFSHRYPMIGRLFSSPLPRTVWVLGLVSLFMGVSSEMIHAVLPLFMAQTLGAGALWIGYRRGLVTVLHH